MFIFLLLLWIVFNGRFTVEILLFGIAISAVICFFAVKCLNYSFKKEFHALKLLPSMLAYLGVLIVEIVKANFSVAGILLKPGRKPEPVIYHFRTDLKSSLARTVLANSITLTPGTITVSLKEDEYTIHCLDRSLATGLEDSVFTERLKAMEAKL